MQEREDRMNRLKKVKQDIANILDIRDGSEREFRDNDYN